MEYIVTFKTYEDSPWCTNVAVGRSMEDVEGKYEGYEAVYVKQATGAEADALKARGCNVENCCTVKALELSVYSNPTYRRCANGGWTEFHDYLYVACDEGNLTVYEDDPALFDIGSCLGTVHLRPFKDGLGAGPMMGGSYAATSDSRFSRMCEELTGHPWNGAIAVHDRYE